MGLQEFTYDATALAEYEKRLLHRFGVLLGALKYLDENEKTQFTINFISDYLALRISVFPFE